MPGVTYTERTVNSTSYNPGPPAPGGLHRILFGAIILQQSSFLSSADSYTERTCVSTSYTEKPVSSTAYTERSV